MKHLLVAIAALALLGAMQVTPASAFTQSSCEPTPVGQDGVFFLKASADCPASAYMSRTDAEQTESIGESSVTDYVLIGDLVNVQDTSQELFVLVRPFSYQTDVLGQVLAQAMRDGKVGDLGVWQDVSVQ